MIRLLHMRKTAKKLPRLFVLRSKDLEEFYGSRVAIKRSAEQGNIQSLGSGFYASPSLDPMTASVIAVAKYFPQAVISGRTALFLHDLSDHAVKKIDVDISGTTIANKLLNTHRVAKKRLVGISKITLKGFKIKIFDLERSLCEAYKLDPAGAEFFTALKRYLKKTEPDTVKIKKYDKALGTKVLLHIRQELADG
jgi:predicted transcriptional regulator of viral defense system